MNILVIDDHKLIQEGLHNRIKNTFSGNITCKFESKIDKALSTIRTENLDLIISDLDFDNNSKKDGFTLVKEVLKLKPKSKIIALSHHNSYDIMNDAIKSGFLSFLNKGSSFEDFKQTLTRVYELGTEYESSCMKILKKQRNKHNYSIFKKSLSGINELSDKELEVVILAKTTTNRRELSKIMNKSPFTVDTHFKNILEKLSLENRQYVKIFSLEFHNKLLKVKDRKTKKNTSDVQ